MYAQMTTIRVPLNQIEHLREVIADSYLPVIRTQPGFQSGFLLEKDDDSDRAYLVVFWSSQADVENFNSTSILQASLHTLAVEVSGIHVQREGYLVRISTLVDTVPE